MDMSLETRLGGGRIARGDTPYGNYTVEWDAEGQLVAENLEIRKPEPEKPRGLCAHLGGELRRVMCKSCGGAVKIKVMSCSVHGECTSAKSAPGVSAVCRSCTDWEPRHGA